MSGASCTNYGSKAKLTPTAGCTFVTGLRIVLYQGFQMKTQKTPNREIAVAAKRMKRLFPSKSFFVRPLTSKCKLSDPLVPLWESGFANTRAGDVLHSRKPRQQ